MGDIWKAEEETPEQRLAREKYENEQIRWNPTLRMFLQFSFDAIPTNVTKNLSDKQRARVFDVDVVWRGEAPPEDIPPSERVLGTYNRDSNMIRIYCELDTPYESLLNTITHELVHCVHPRMKDPSVRKTTTRWLRAYLLKRYRDEEAKRVRANLVLPGDDE